MANVLPKKDDYSEVKERSKQELLEEEIKNQQTLEIFYLRILLMEARNQMLDILIRYSFLVLALVLQRICL